MLWRNPLFIRFCRSQLRLKKALFWYALVLIGSAFTLSIIYVPQVVRGTEPLHAARMSLVPLLIIQGILLLFLGTGSVAGGITREKVEKVLNYQRLSPLPIHQKIMGYLFGLPVREYVLFAITLPFLLFVLVVGRIPASAFLPYYIILFTSTLLYHFTGLVAGMISTKWRWSARISQGLIILLYFVLPQLSHIGLVFLEFLTVRPVFTEKILPLVARYGEGNQEMLGLLAGQSVPLFWLTVSGTGFSFFIQVALICLFARIVARKWRSDSVPAIGKPMALVTFLVFCVMSLGNIWPNLIRADNALDIFHSNGDLENSIAIAVLPLVLAFTATALACVLMTSCLADPQRFRQGQIRARRFGADRLSSWADAAAGYRITQIFALVLATVLVIAYHALYRAGYFEGMASNPFQAGFLILSSILFLFYFQGLKETFGGGQMGMFLLLHWMLPVLGAILVIAIDTGLREWAILLLALSPLALLPLSAIQLIPAEQLNDLGPALQRGLGLGYLLLFLLTGWLHLRLRRRSRPVPDAASGTAASP